MYQEIKPLIENGWYDAAISALEKIVEDYPDKAVAYQELGALYYKQGQTENALSSYRKAMQLEPENIAAQKNLADFYYAELGQADEALKIYENILIVAPDDVQTLTMAGHIHVSMNRFEAAREKYLRVLDIEPWNAEARQYLEALQQHGAGEGRTKSAATLYQEIEPLISSNQTDAAIYGLEELLATYPDFALAHNDLGVLYFQQGDKTAAQLHYEHAVRYEPGNMIFQKNLADFYFVELNRIQEAMDIYVKILETSPEDVETLLTAGHISVALQRFDDARDIYNRVLEIEPWNADARQFLDAMDNAQTGSPTNAPALSADNGPIISAPEKSAQEMYHEIQPLLNSGDSEAAVEALQKLLSVHPDFALAHNDLGVLCYQQGNKETAQSHYEHASRLQPDNITFQKNLADFYFVECNRVQEAMDIYVGILETHPEDIETLMTAGHISAALQRFDDARTIYERVLEIEPWNADARQSLDNLDDPEKGRNLQKPISDGNFSPVQGGSISPVS
jgi:tetratricopeptide (TPR) repeat protein